MENYVYLSGLDFSGLDIMQEILEYLKIDNSAYKTISLSEAIEIKSKELNTKHIIFVRNPYLLFMYTHKINPTLSLDVFIDDKKINRDMCSIQNLLIDYPLRNNSFVTYLPFEFMGDQIDQFIVLINTYFNTKISKTDELKIKYKTLIETLKSPDLKSPEIDSYIYATIRKKWWWFYSVFYNEK